MRWLTAALEWQSRAVVRRHLRVHLQNWHIAFLPPAVEPVTMLIAFGVGLGGYVTSVPWQDREVGYLTFVAPGLLAYATFMTSMFQALFAAFIRMRYQRTWFLPALLPIAFVAGCAFAALGLCFTALLPTIDHMNLPVFLLVLPLGLLSATYFPLEHPTLLALSAINPLYHLAQGFRGLLLGGPAVKHLAGLAVLSVLMLGVLVPLDLRLLRRRVLGD